MLRISTKPSLNIAIGAVQELLVNIISRILRSYQLEGINYLVENVLLAEPNEVDLQNPYCIMDQK